MMIQIEPGALSRKFIEQLRIQGVEFEKAINILQEDADAITRLQKKAQQDFSTFIREARKYCERK